MKKVNMNFIAQNVAPIDTKQVTIFDSDGNLVATLPLGGLTPKHQGEKKYSFGALSDIHLPYAAQNASTDFQEALTYLNNVANVDFICISGDMSDKGTDAEWLDYKNHVDMYSPNTPVHLSAGNHDASPGLTYNYPIKYTGNPLYYSFNQGGDVFIMFGMSAWSSTPFTREALQWLYDILEENKDKRCFVFQHMMRLDGCGNAHGLYGWDGLNNTHGKVFLSLMEHYKNVIWFHGHSHTPFRLQSTQPTPIANYDRLHGCHSVHIPSLAVPRYGNSDDIFDAEGYVVDVYENGIHLRGIDFIEKEFVPIASYWIDTTPVKILEGSYVDIRGVITKKCISLPGGSELIMNQRYSYSEKGLVTDTTTPPMFTAIIPVMSGTDYVLKIKNSNIDITTASSSVIYGIDSSKMPAQQINGSGNIPSMTTGITLSEDKKSADITFTTAGNVSYIALSLRALVSGTLTENDIKDYKIEIEAQSIKNPEEDTENEPIEGFSTDLLQTYEVKINQRWSSSANGYADQDGMIALTVPYSEIKYRTLRLVGFTKKTADGSAWYAYDSSGVSLGRIAAIGSGVVWDSSALIDNGDGTYDIPMYKELFVDSNKPITTEPTTINISMRVSNASITSFDGCRILVSDKDPDNPIEGFSTDLLETCDIQLNKRWSGSSSSYTDQNGTLVFSVPFADINGRVIKMIGFERENGGISTWYAYKNGSKIGRIANLDNGTVWRSDALIDNGDGTYDITADKEIFISYSTSNLMTEIPDTIYISMYVDDSAITSTDGFKMLVSDIEYSELTQGEITSESNME